MAIIKRENRDGSYSYQVKVKDQLGRWMASKTFDRRADAKWYQDSLREQTQSGWSDNGEGRRLSVSDFWKKWSVECRDRVSDGWKLTQDQMFQDYCINLIGTMRLSDITPSHIAGVIQNAAKRGLSDQTLLHIFGILHKMFFDAIEHYQFLQRSPVLRRLRPKVRKKPRRFLNPKESLVLLKYSREHWLGPAIWIGLYAGLRSSEVQGLRWGAVDFERAQILIQEVFNRKMWQLQHYPKQGDFGVAPIVPALAAFLQVKKGKPNEFVVQGPRTQALSHTSFYRGLKKLCQEIGLPEITPHGLRHSCTELWVDAGASEEDIRRLLNHKSASTTKAYMHRTGERLQGIAERVAAPQLEAPKTA